MDRGIRLGAFMIDQGGDADLRKRFTTLHRLSHPLRIVGVMVVIREFMYRCDDLVAQFLDQMEGGEYADERISERSGRTSGVGGSAGLGLVSESAERRRDGGTDTELTMRRTAAPRFNRLHALNPEQRRKGGKSAALTIRLQHPAAVVSAIAMYR